MPISHRPKIYHIVHIDRLPSIIRDGYLWSDREMSQRPQIGSIIGMNDIKMRRLRLPLQSHSNLRVGDCVPFYFCARSVMLYVIAMANHPALTYRGGQGPILHLEADLYQVVEWADQNHIKWAFTLSNAGSNYFEDRSNIEELDQINWNSVYATKWHDQAVKENKQAEFLIENKFPWELFSRIGVYSQNVYNQVYELTRASRHHPLIEIRQDWYY